MTELERSVRNDTIQFATMRRPGSRFAVLDRRIVITAPPELVTLLRAGDPSVLDALVEMLGAPDRSWAAEVALAAATQREETIVDSYAATPEKWSESPVGQGARNRWRAWLQSAKPNWDPDTEAFLEGG